MTREEAIKDIKENIKPIVGGKSLDMAIQSLTAISELSKSLKAVNRYEMDEKVLIGFNMAVAIFNNYFGEESCALKNEQTDGDLISRELAKQMVRDRFNNLSERVEINTVLNEVPSAEKTAEWIFVDNKKIIAKCSNCTLLHDTMYGTRHCPNCGAKMKGELE